MKHLIIETNKKQFFKNSSIPKEIVFLSGKGGTGKTTITSSVVKIIKEKIIVDADVDAADLFILLNPSIYHKEVFKGKSIAEINQNMCTGCGICYQYCRFNAINYIDETYKINPLLCDGCTFCSIVCPESAISMKRGIAGEWYISNTKYGKMVHAKLLPGEENSGNLINIIKFKARTLAEELQIPLIIIDGPPGVGCPVTSSLSGAYMAVIITEPTVSGLSDLDRIIQVAKHFNVKTGIVINKADLNNNIKEKIYKYSEKNKVKVFGEVSLDKCVVDAQRNKLTPIEFDKCLKVKEEIEYITKVIIQEVGI